MSLVVGCEFTGEIREAFGNKGIISYSVDLIETEKSPGFNCAHYKMDVIEAIEYIKPKGIIVHPPCTFLCNSGVRWLYNNDHSINPKRWDDMKKASAFFKYFINLDIPYICIENPIPHNYADLPKYTQIIQPWQFGHGETKATCLWLKGFPKLVPTKIVKGREHRIHEMSFSPNRGKERSRTYPGIAHAMAEQWSCFL